MRENHFEAPRDSDMIAGALQARFIELVDVASPREPPTSSQSLMHGSRYTLSTSITLTMTHMIWCHAFRF